MIPILIFGGLVYGGARFLGYDLIDAIKNVMHGEPAFPQGATPAIDWAASHVVTAQPELPPSNPTGQATAPALPPPRLADAPGSPVTTQATPTESAKTLRLVQPPQQPRVPSTSDEQKARGLAPEIERKLTSNPDGPNYMARNEDLVTRIKQFQSAINIGVDGRYGPTTAGALMYFLGHAPPPPFFYAGERVIYLYAPM